MYKRLFITILLSLTSSGCLKVDSADSSSSESPSSAASASSDPTFVALDEYSLSASANSKANAIVFSSADEANIAGASESATTNYHWTVRRESSGSFSVIDDYQLSSGKNAFANDLLFDENGLLFVVGSALDANGFSHWIVRKETSPGVWTTSDDFQLGANAPAAAKAIVYLESTRDYAVVGHAVSGGASHWIVRVYDHGVGTWSTVEDLSAASVDMIPTDIAYESSNGYIAVVGYTLSAAGDFAYARVYDGSSWKDLDPGYQLSANKGAYHRAAVYGFDGSLIITGHAYDASDKANLTTFIVDSANPFDPPTLIESFQYQSGYDSFGTSLTRDSGGNIYVTGRALNAASEVSLISRSSTDAGLKYNEYFTISPSSDAQVSALAVAVNAYDIPYAAGLYYHSNLSTWVALALE